MLLHIEKEPSKHVHKVRWGCDRETLQAEVLKLKMPFIINHVPNYSVKGAFKAMELLQAKEDVLLSELKSLIDFDTASQRWKDLYDLFPEGSQVEPLLEVEDPQGCIQFSILPLWISFPFWTFYLADVFVLFL